MGDRGTGEERLSSRVGASSLDLYGSEASRFPLGDLVVLLIQLTECGRRPPGP